MYRYTICAMGAAIKNSDHKFNASSAYVIYNNKSLKRNDVNLLLGHSSKYAEYHSIYSATKHCLNDYSISIYDEVVIATDSEEVVHMLNNDFKAIIFDSPSEILIDSKGLPIKNQDIIKATYMNLLLLKEHVDVKIININSNIPDCKYHSYYEDIKRKVDMKYDDFIQLCEGNKKCIEMIEKSFNNLKSEDDEPFNYDPSSSEECDC